MNDLISIVIPVYKVEDYLNRCVKSVISQTYRNLEIILVNDGSPDKCGEICDEYARADSRIKVIHKINGGLSDARNKGIDLSSGKFITFLDSDDWIHEEYIERLYNLIKMSDSDISICNFMKSFTEENQIERKKNSIYEYTNIEALNQLSGDYYIQFVVAWGKLYKRDLFNDIRFPNGKIHEDEYVSHQLIYYAKKIIYTTEQLLYYWQRPDSITGIGFNMKHKLHSLLAYQHRAEFYESKGLIELRDKTNKTTFFIYKQIIDHYNLNHEKHNKELFMSEYKAFKNVLKNGDYDIKFTLFYNLYYLAPSLMRRIEKIYRNVIKDD